MKTNHLLAVAALSCAAGTACNKQSAPPAAPLAPAGTDVASTPAASLTPTPVSTPAAMTEPAAGVHMHVGYAQTMARMAYVWGWPLVNMLNRKAAITSAPARRLLWDVRLTDAHGVRRYPLGPDISIDLSCAARRAPGDPPRVDAAASGGPVEIEVRWAGGARVLTVGR